MSPATGRDYLYDLPPAKPVSYNSVFRQMVGATEEGIALQAACIDVSTPNREGGGEREGERRTNSRISRTVSLRGNAKRASQHR